MAEKKTVGANPSVGPAPRGDPNPTSPLEAALRILGVKSENVLAHRTRDDGSCVIVVNQGQKFVFTRDELAHPKAARTRLRAEGLRVLPPLDPTRLANQAQPDDGLPDD